MKEKVSLKIRQKLFLKCCAGQLFSSITYDVLTCLNRSIKIDNKPLSVQKLTFLYSIYSLPNIGFPLVLNRIIQKLNRHFKNKTNSQITQLLSIVLYFLIVSSSFLFLMGIYTQSYFLLCLSRLVFGISDSYTILQSKIISELVDNKFYGFYISIFYGSGKIGSAFLFYTADDLIASYGVLFITIIGCISSLFGLMLEIYGYFSLQNEIQILVIEKSPKNKPTKNLKSLNDMLKLEQEFMDDTKNFSLFRLLSRKALQFKKFLQSFFSKDKEIIIIKEEVYSKILSPFLILLLFSYIQSTSSSFSSISPLIFQTRYHSEPLAFTTKQLAIMEITSLFISICLNLISDFFDYRIYLVLLGSSILIFCHSLILNIHSFTSINKPKIISIFFGISSPLINCYSPFIIKCISEGHNKNEVLGKAYSIISCISSVASVVTPMFIGFLSKTDKGFFKTEIFYLIMCIISFCLVFQLLINFKEDIKS